VLGSNAIGPAGARAIAEALKVPELPLTTLLLANNKLGPEGGRAVAQASPHPTHISCWSPLTSR
jgi:Ran GTPase-activating protein (RanGAP) involved in mRNA processing and transport